MARTPSSDNPCPQEEFIRQFAKMLDVTQDVASHIYETFTVTCIKLLREYDGIKVLPFVYLERKMTKSKNMYNVNTGETGMSVPREKLTARVTKTYDNMERAEQYIERYEERLRKQEIYMAQVEQEREEKRKEIEEYKRKQRKNAKRRSRYHRQKDRMRQRAIERMIEDEARFELHEKEQFKKDLYRRLKG